MNSKPAILIWVLLSLVFVAMLFWSRSRDPFQRIWFTISSTGHGSAKCVAVLPKTKKGPLPVVIYLHGVGGDLTGSGNDLRQIAEMGLAAVGMEYNQTNDLAFEAQFDALNRHLRRQKWADTNAVAWIGFSLGAQKQLSFALKHPEAQPQLLVRVAGGWLPELDEIKRQNAEGSPPASDSRLPSVLILHGEQDAVFPVSDARRVAEALVKAGASVDVKILPGQGHGLQPNRELIFRALGEYCLVRLEGEAALANYRSIALRQEKAWPLWVWWIPAFVWTAAWIWLRSRHSAKSPSSVLTRRDKALRVVAAIVVVVAVAQTAVHLLLPRLRVTDTTLGLARRFLVQQVERADFDFLAAQPVWSGECLKSLLTHVELAHYNRGLVNWQLDDRIYRDFVLSPVISADAGLEMNWRRPLWESFYPRIRKEHSVSAAAEIVARHLRERVTIVDDPTLSSGVESIWQRQITNEKGFHRIYVASLRSAGVPARLNEQGIVEFWATDRWFPAPEPLLWSWGKEFTGSHNPSS